MFLSPTGYENEEGSGGEFNSRVKWVGSRIRFAVDDGGRYGGSSSDADEIEKELLK